MSIYPDWLAQAVSSGGGGYLADKQIILNVVPIEFEFVMESTVYSFSTDVQDVFLSTEVQEVSLTTTAPDIVLTVTPIEYQFSTVIPTIDLEV